MTEPDRGGRSLTTRIAVAFTAVALMAVALVVMLVIISTSQEASSLARSERQQAASRVAASAADAYRRAGGWAEADLGRALQLGPENGRAVTILDPGGNVVAYSGGGRGPVSAPNSTTADIRVGEQSVGSVVVRSPGSGLSRAQQHLRDRLATVAIVGGALAVLLALIAAVLAARRLTAPLRRLTAAAGALERGEPGARAGADAAPGEIGELSRAFDTMAQALEDQTSRRDMMLAEIAHELRTPLSILRGNCEAMVDGVEQPSPDMLASLHEEVLRLQHLVADLETLSASDATFLRLDREPVDLAAIAGDVVSLLSGQASEAGISVTTELSQVIVKGDRARLTQIVENLVTNALKFTPEDGTVTVRAKAADDGAVIEVSDTGAGIPADELTHVFDRFWRGSNAATVGGRGIGLAVVDELTRAHGGMVSVASSPHDGSTFTVQLPAL